MKWIDYLSDYLSFNFIIKIPITSDNYKVNILEFDERLLHVGKLYGIYFFQLNNDYNLFVKEYLNYRKNKIQMREEGYIKLLDLFQWPYFTANEIDKNIATIIPIKGKDNEFQLEPYCSSCEKGKNPLININSYQAINFDQIKEDYFWYEYLYLSISSNSNIWFDELNIVKLKDNYKYLDSPIDNRMTSYRLTPRFNSFLRAVKKIAIELGGEVNLDDNHSNNVEKNGILIDGTIIYQEDINAGKVSLP